MKRRAFFGLMGGAAVAGPGMVKQAASATLADLALPNAVDFSPVTYFDGGRVDINAVSSSDRSLVRDKWQAFQAIVNSSKVLAQRKRQMPVHQLDPDLAASRSFSLDAKIRMQRERNFKAWLEREQGWFTRNWDSDDETSRWY